LLIGKPSSIARVMKTISAHSPRSFLSVADLLTTPDEDLIRHLHRTIKRIERLLKRYDPQAPHLEEERKRSKAA